MKNDNLSKAEVVRRLTIIGEMKMGDPWPDFLSENWGPPLSALCAQAAELIADKDDKPKLIVSPMLMAYRGQ